MEIFKVCLIGNAGVGKTSIIHSFIHRKFTDKLPPTTGFETLDVIVKFKLHPAYPKSIERQVKLWICDTAGEESESGLSRSYFRGASAILVVCSYDDDISLENFTDLVHAANNHCSKDKLDKEYVRIYNVFNKTDLIPAEEDSDVLEQKYWNFP